MKDHSDIIKFRASLLGLKGKLFLLKTLPLAFLAGVRPVEFNEERCTTGIRFRWINQNPFRSLYFAAMHMTAELSCGLLLFQYLYTGHSFSMLLVKSEGNYIKKAVGKITFSCDQAQEVKNVVESLDDTTLLPLHVTGKDSDGEIVANFTYYWSLKKRPRR